MAFARYEQSATKAHKTYSTAQQHVIYIKNYGLVGDCAINDVGYGDYPELCVNLLIGVDKTQLGDFLCQDTN